MTWHSFFFPFPIYMVILHTGAGIRLQTVYAHQNACGQVTIASHRTTALFPIKNAVLNMLKYVFGRFIVKKKKNYLGK